MQQHPRLKIVKKILRPIPASSTATAPTEHVDLSLIVVDKSTSGLKEIFQEAPFNTIQHATDLLSAFAASPNFTTSELSDDVLALIKRITTADPNSASFGPDENNENWGHSQFASWAVSLTDWAAVGNTKYACELIAAAVQTCKSA
ncbi:hypothetical protein CPB83DRAFT_899579 [Crepidotus variabilis]|uniref:Uncharacterized protein n=1 Tax=Crepidotus variabilis TaxID=179855 RepID=A0A9P6E4U2_9AGAR|nr:hypothetical protein CPB83DRAFT_899579 [Crepidotus variabilis]